jgi:hypothetical protein
MNDIEKVRLLDETHERLRGISAALVERFGADDVAGLLLVQSMAVMNLDKDAAQAAKWLRELAASVETVGVVAAISKHDLN